MNYEHDPKLIRDLALINQGEQERVFNEASAKQMRAEAHAAFAERKAARAAKAAEIEAELRRQQLAAA